MPLDPVAYLPYKDPDDFIREVTDLIWVDRSIHYIRENYEPDSIVHGAYGTSTNRAEVIEGTLMRISATPDRTGQAADVIWEARGDDAFLSSHLVLSGHLQSSAHSYTIANCLYRKGRMVEEWVAPGALLVVASLRGPATATRAAIAQLHQGGLPMPFSFLQSQPGQMLAGLCRHLRWRGDARFVLSRNEQALLNLVQREGGPAGVLLGWVDEGAAPRSEWWRMVPADPPEPT